MNSFEKMLKEKKYKPIVKNLATKHGAIEEYVIADFFVLKLEDQCEWEWENGGERFVRYWGGTYGHREGLFDYLVAHAIYMMDTPSWGVERTIEADRFLRVYRFNKAWIKQKVREIEKE